MTEIKLIRELMEKDVGYIKEQLEGITDRLDKLNGSVADNTKYRYKMKTTVGIIASAVTIVATGLTVIINKLWK